MPLSAQSVAVLREVEKLTGQGTQVFPNQHKSSGCMSENTMLYALYRMGYHSRATGHGFPRVTPYAGNESCASRSLATGRNGSHAAQRPSPDEQRLHRPDATARR